MDNPETGLNRRDFLVSTATVAAASALPLAPAQAKAKYTRYNAASPEGKRMLKSYAKGVRAMMKLPPDDPRNWFRNAFIHMMDCPHGNWWFYVWHRGYLGYFEETIRKLSGDDRFAIPYWDWTASPEIQSEMFDGVLTPNDGAFAPYTGNFAKFTDFIKPSLRQYWGTLSTAQLGQMSIRGYAAFDDLWMSVAGYDPDSKQYLSGNLAYAITCGARYLTRENPKLDPKTAFQCSKFMVTAGLMPIKFYDEDNYLSFNSSRTSSHEVQPSGATKFSVLEGHPHNKVHNYIGGVGPIDPGPYGNMTNFLSPVDPVFFLHHANMDRLWDVWTRKQQALDLPYLPTGDDWTAYGQEPFLFYANSEGGYVGPKTAADFVNMDVFNYDYQPGYGEWIIEDVKKSPTVKMAATAPKPTAVSGATTGKTATVKLPASLAARARATAGTVETAFPTALSITVAKPHGGVTAREFDVLINAPANAVAVKAGDPFYAGTIAFFGGHSQHMQMSHDATFLLPLPATLKALNAEDLQIRLVPSGADAGPTPDIKGVEIKGAV